MSKPSLLLKIVFITGFLFFFSLNAQEKKDEKKGFLTIHTQPSGLDIYIDGKKAGTSPIEKLSLPVGSHKISVATEPCFKQILFYTWNRNVNIFESDTSFLQLEPEPIMKEINISELKVGNKLLEGNDIYVDRKKVGTVPSKIEIPICSKLLEVTEIDGKKVVYSSNLDLVKGEITKNDKRGYEIATVDKAKSKMPSATSIKEFKSPESSESSGFKAVKLKKKPKKNIIGPYKWIGTGFIIGGALLAGVGGLFDYLAWKEFQDYEKMGTEEEIRDQLNNGDVTQAEYLIKRDDHYEKGKDFAIARNVFLAAGGAFAVTGIVLLFVKPSKKEKKVETSFNFIPGPNGFFISTDISF